MYTQLVVLKIEKESLTVIFLFRFCRQCARLRECSSELKTRIKITRPSRVRFV